MPTLLTTNDDPMDFTQKYNTKLSAEDKAKFDKWAKSLSEKLGRDVTRDMYDYDLAGAWKSGAAQADNGHFPDTFKKPNHPTFSNQSQYNGADGIFGGQWGKDDQGRDTFTPGAGSMWSPEDLEGYFKKAEPEALLVPRPQGAADILYGK